MVTTATFEGTSNAVLESFAHNTPVLCLSDALGLNETVVHNQNGLLCKNAKEMSESVKSLLLQPDFLKKLSNGCEMIKEQILDENLGVKKYLNVINELSFDHDQLHRNDLAKVSKKVLDQPGSYRESLDAVVCYINLEDFNKKHLQSFFNTQACLEADKIFFIYISKNEKTTLDFEKFLSNYNKCSIQESWSAQNENWPYEWSEYCEGCVDPYALNFDENAGTYDGTCDYDSDFEDNYTFLGTFEGSSYYHSSNSLNLNWHLNQEVLRYSLVYGIGLIN